MKSGLSAFICVTVFSLTFFLTGCPFVDKICGASGKDPGKFFGEASPQARALVERAWQDVPDKVAFDCHVHVLDDNREGNGSFINPKSKTILRASQYFKMKAYFSAGHVKDKKRIGEQYIAHLVKLARNCGHPVRLYALAFDKYYDHDGNAVLSKTDLYISNEFVLELSRKYPDIFVPVISVHPYRKDAVAELEKWATEGVHMVKWIPNVQGIDPADERIEPFYRAMKRLNMTLLVHSGEEHALESYGQQHLGNPLLLRKPLDCGVRVIIAHCASSGVNTDLDDPQKRKVHNFDLFLRLMDEDRYRELLFADISGVIQFNRMDKALANLLKRKDLHARLINGSDYPLPALNVLVNTGKLAKNGYITRDEQKALQEIYDYNPLLFDFVLKRIVRLPGTGQSFPPGVFHHQPI